MRKGRITAGVLFVASGRRERAGENEGGLLSSGRRKALVEQRKIVVDDGKCGKN